MGQPPSPHLISRPPKETAELSSHGHPTPVSTTGFSLRLIQVSPLSIGPACRIIMLTPRSLRRFICAACLMGQRIILRPMAVAMAGQVAQAVRRSTRLLTMPVPLGPPSLRLLMAVSYTHLTLPTNREVY